MRSDSNKYSSTMICNNNVEANVEMVGEKKAKERSGKTDLLRKLHRVFFAFTKRFTTHFHARRTSQHHIFSEALL